MRYTEKESFGDEKGILQKILCAVTAPVRLCKELSTKFIFLKRSLIERILIIAILFSIIGILIELCIAKLVGNIHWLDGKFPFICKVVGFGVIVILYLFYELHEFTIYKQINKLVMNHVVHKENMEDIGIASELFRAEENIDDKTENDAIKQKNVEINLSLLDSGTEEQTISIDPSLFGDGNSISLDEMFDNIELESKSTLKKDDKKSLNQDNSEISETLLMPEVMEQSSENINNQEKVVNNDVAIDIPNGQDVIDYQTQLQNCINDLLSSGIEYVGSLSDADITEMEEEIRNADFLQEAQIDLEIAEKGVSFEYEKELEVLNIQKSWKVPEGLKEVI